MNFYYRTSLKVKRGCDVMKMAQKETTTMIAAPRYTNLKSYNKRNCKVLSNVILAAKKLHYNRIMEFYEIIKTKYTIHCILTYVHLQYNVEYRHIPGQVEIRYYQTHFFKKGMPMT